ncbi:MAG: hypothetical protein FWD69_18400 [Polyangiaceae bacterium]|nr:hypothetical protein [Polyangiaceae bacterium]
MRSARRRSIPSVLHNFLDTLSSRYSDYDGYWIFGLVISDLNCSTISLVAGALTTSGSPSWCAFVTLARSRFADQAKMNSVTSFIRRAELSIERGPSHLETVSGQTRNGYDVALVIGSLILLPPQPHRAVE